MGSRIGTLVWSLRAGNRERKTGLGVGLLAWGAVGVAVGALGFGELTTGALEGLVAGTRSTPSAAEFGWQAVSAMQPIQLVLSKINLIGWNKIIL